MFGTEALFRDRAEAGRRLADRLLTRAVPKNAVVLGLARGGMVVGAVIADALHLDLDVLVIRKLGAPTNPELAMGAVASGGVRVINREVVRILEISDREIEDVTQAEMREMIRRDKLYRGGRPPHPLSRRPVILVDDGLATGATMEAAIAAVKQRRPSRLTVAVPVASTDAAEMVEREVDELVCLSQPPGFGSVGAWYKEFEQVTDQQVMALLESGTHATSA